MHSSMDDYSEKLGQVDDLSPEELEQLGQSITAAFDAAHAAGDLDAMSAAGAAYDKVQACKARVAAAEPTEPVAAAAGPDDDEEDDAEEDDDTPEFLKKKGVQASGNQENEETKVDIPEDRQPRLSAPLTVITAGADIPGINAGHQFTSADEVSDAMLKRIDSVRGSAPSNQKHLVATLRASIDPSRILDRTDVDGNRAKIEAVVGKVGQAPPEALVAAGGYCAPLENRYDIFGLGVTDRPVKAALGGFGASRGGIRFNTPPVLGDLEDAVSIWSAAQDANPGSDVKARLRVECADEQTATLDAVVLFLEFGNLMARAYPELVSANTDLAMVQHARLGELTLLSKISALSTGVSSTRLLGTARDFLVSIGKASAAYRQRHRMNNQTPLRVIAPNWVRDAMREDISMGLPGDRLAVADAEINSYLANRNVNVAWHLDDTRFASEVHGSALDDFPSSFKFNIFAEGTFIFLDGGTLDLGVVRDVSTIETNDYVTFVETFEGVAKVGVEAIEVTVNTSLRGGVASTVTVA